MGSSGPPGAIKRLVLMGPPGAGKGTQAKMVAEAIGGSHIASGDLFRSHQSRGTPLGKKAMEYMNHGLLVPDEVTIAMVLEEITPPRGQRGFLLDGFPRNLLQARTLDEALAGRGDRIDKALLLEVPVEELVQRLSGRLVCRQCQAPYHRDTAAPKEPDVCDLCGGALYQREDDSPEAVRVRLRVYQDETEPLVGYYSKAGALVTVDGVGKVEEVGQRLLSGIQD